MQISLRSQLIAGTAAVVGASAIAMTPVTAAHLNLPAVQVPSLAQVTLAGFDSPISELLGTLVLSTNYLFNTDGGPAEIADPLNWAFSGFPGSGEGALGGFPIFPPALLTDAAGGYSSIGLIPQIIDDALPIISQLGYNGLDYLQVTSTSLYAAGLAVSEGIWNAAGDLLSFDIAGAIQSLLGGVSQAGSWLLTAGGYVLSGVVGRLTAVVETVLELVPTLLGGTLLQAQALVGSVTGVVTGFFDAIGGGDFEGAWNAVVDGLLGPSGIPGRLVNLTIGAGVQTDPITAFNPVTGEYTPATAFVPSIRTEVQAGVNAIAGALATPVTPLGGAAVAVPAAAAVAEVEEAPAAVTEVKEAPAAVTEVKEAPAAEAPAAPAATAGDNDGAAKANTPKRAPRAGKRG